jgi:AcrR family transcriptional regulator
MPRKPESNPTPSKRRRTGDEARARILDAAERQLVAAGPAGIRLQEVAADVGVSHPTVLHHFGSREGLIEAVVARALASLHAGLLDAVQASPKGPEHVEAILDRVADALVEGGHARAFFWLALSGYESSMEQLQVRSVAEAVHEVRRAMRKAEGGKRVPPFEDTYFTVLLAALALLSMSVMPPAKGTDADATCGPRRFRAWLARRVHEHLRNA